MYENGNCIINVTRVKEHDSNVVAVYRYDK